MVSKNAFQGHQSTAIRGQDGGGQSKLVDLATLPPSLLIKARENRPNCGPKAGNPCSPDSRGASSDQLRYSLPPCLKKPVGPGIKKGVQGDPVNHDSVATRY